ncbi:MAG: hypothetical protein KI790_18370 [Cyclobacteriaceae bacterium]|nr:hypothetical protein [Cyclobacteriaceae bacterium HetDA_MAG_MS6]
MDILRIKESELEQVTDFINGNQLILHPNISPTGELDFTDYKGKKFTVLLDRNLLSYLLTLVKTGELEDYKARIAISSIMLWSRFNNILLNSGFALIEYANWKKGNIEATQENNIFLKTYDHYPANTWLDLALNRRKTIPILELKEFDEYSFYKESDHFQMHFLEMLKIAELFLNIELSKEEKIINFYRWVYGNILICRYTIIYFPLLVTGKVKTFKKLKNDFSLLISRCKNQAWDLTYLSVWSTLHYNEEQADEIYLFGTFDSELRTIFVTSHRNSDEPIYEMLGTQQGQRIVKELTNLNEKHMPREFRPIDSFDLDGMIDSQLSRVKEAWAKKTASNSR